MVTCSMLLIRTVALLVAATAAGVGANDGGDAWTAHATDSGKLHTDELPQPIPLARTSRADDHFEEIPAQAGRSTRPTIMDIALEMSVREGLEAMTNLYAHIEPEILRNGEILQPNHPAAVLSLFSAPIEDTRRQEMAAFANIAASRVFHNNFKFSDEWARQAHGQKISLRRTALEEFCPPRNPPTCMPAARRYRTHDGTCNNAQRPRWGAAQMPFNRFLPPQYGDGVDSIRDSVEGGALSSSRFVSLLVHGARDGDAQLTLMIAQWGQLLDHDLTSTAQPRSINGSVPSCCGNKVFHPSCFPIKVPLDDPWLSPLKVRCLEFLRSAPAQRRDCVLSWREQTNQATSYIDASPIYSSSSKSSDNGRLFRHGQLIFGRGNPAEDVCQRGALATNCIRAGDGRSGEQPGLLALHLVWVNEHNRIASDLSDMNPHWSDEKVYQETRRIIGALFQHITYREFLPIVLGREVCKLFDLELLGSGYYEGYNPKVNPTVANSFAAAAFRFGHSLIQNSYLRCDRHHNIISNNVSLHEEFQRGDIGSAGSLHRLLRGLATQKTLRRDEFITPELTNHLFQTPGFPFGLDLAAINIQRGRDHGIAPYTAWRVPCGLTPITTWEDFGNVVGPESARRISHAYRNVHDIDLFVGGIAERPVVGGLVGPTFACIIAQQFSNSRRGDRFWYENGGFESSFTPAQLQSLRHVSLAQVICRAVGGGTLQQHIFIPADFPGNERLPCGSGSLAPIDLTPWLEQDPFGVPTPMPTFSNADPEPVFSPVSIAPTTSPLAALQALKENKVGFPPRNNTPELAISHAPQVELVPNSSVGIQRRKEPLKINDKLDFKRKPSGALKPSQKTHSGVSNKLDKKPQTTASSAKKQRRPPTTTRRTVIVNNIPIELRNAASSTTVAIDPDDLAEAALTDRLEARTDNEDVDLPNGLLSKWQTTNDIPCTLNDCDKTTTPKNDDPFDLFADPTDMTTRNTQEATTNRTVPDISLTLAEHREKTDVTSEPDPTDIDPNEHAQTSELRRVQRGAKTKRKRGTTTPKSASGVTKSTSKSGTSTVRPKTTVNLAEKKQSGDVTPTPAALERSAELKQYQPYPQQTQSVYERPHKVVLNGPNADQYEIEINIRQTNKNSNDYTPVYGPYDKYTSSTPVPFPSYVDYGSTTPNYGYYQQHQMQAKRTKPPTIIYLNEHDIPTTTKAPNFLQSIITFATNNFNTNHNWAPTPASVQRPVTSAPPNDKPTYEINIFGPPSSSIVSRPTYASTPQAPFLVGGTVAASSVISAGNFGSIAGLASSNGANSIFSFNIRPRPSLSAGLSEAEVISGGDLTPQRPIFGTTSSPDYLSRPVGHSQNEALYRPHPASSPFSTAAIKRPSDYYTRTQGRHETIISDLTLKADHRQNAHDTEYASRLIDTVTNMTKPGRDDIIIDYEIEEDRSSGIVQKFDKDGYLRPEHMTGILVNETRLIPINVENRTISTNTTHAANSTSLDDNYVLPVMNVTKTELPTPATPTNTETQSKHLPTNVLADENSQDYIDTYLFAKNTQSRNAQKGTKIAFAPLNVLTKAERPDNWVIYDTPQPHSALPTIPIIPLESLHAAEVPTPIRQIDTTSEDSVKNGLTPEHKGLTSA